MVSSHIIKEIENGASAGPSGYTKVSRTTPEALGPDSKKLANQINDYSNLAISSVTFRSKQSNITRKSVYSS